MADRQGQSHVAFFSLVFAPDGVSTAHVMSDLAEDLQSSGNRVSVITTRPHQVPDSVASARQPLTPLWGPLLSESNYRGIRVLHTWVPARARAPGRRILGWLSFHAIGFLAGLFAIERPKVIIAPSPLLSAGFVAWLLTVFRGGRYVYNVQEMYPDLAVRLGALRNRALIRILLGLESFVYRRAFAVTVIGPSMERSLHAKGVPAAKVRLIPNFVDLTAIAAVDKRNPFSVEYAIADKFVVSYAGNMGRYQGLGRILEAAAKLEKEADLRFVFVGDGVMREQLVQQAGKLGLTTVVFVAHQPLARVPDIYGASDVCVVPMIEEIAAEAVPSKVYRIMAAERPILALTARDGDLGTLVTQAGSGVVVDPVTIDSIVAAILELRRDPARCREMGRRGREHVSRYYGRPRTAAAYQELVAMAAAAD